MLTDQGEFVKGANVECASYGMSLSLSYSSYLCPGGEGEEGGEAEKKARWENEIHPFLWTTLMLSFRSTH